ncbi:MAG: Stk1 family PASTA domain-containing Ser/Thr kinase [Acutalibacteraceae bacterium]|nr:Stk1 family PASTA domain-containing Ser/Thr kinase [Acutalibacteraceae bacterium]
MDKFLGKRLDGRYEINEIIGIGGMAVVYKAYDRIEQRTVSVKILKEEFTKSEEFKQRFQTESKAISMLNHPNIVKIYDVSLGDNFQYIVMEYIDGITLKEYIEKQGVLSWKEALYFTVQILRALQHAHDKGIVHRDVKPQNMMLLRDGTVKVTDFGIARFSRTEKTITEKTIGSVHYISPEQARGDITDEKADLYSMGVLLYEMLTGKLPFDADSAVSVAIMQMQDDPVPPRQINSTIPVGLEQITMRAMMKNPNRRYHSDAEMLRDLEEFKRDPSITFNYDNPYTDSEPTKIISKEELDALTNTTENQQEPETKKSLVPVLSAIASVLVIALGIIAFLVMKGCGGTNVDECPDFFGMYYEDVVEKYPEYNFTFKLANEDAKSVVSKGCIVKQSVDAGTKMKEKKDVTLYYNDTEFVKIPDVTNYKDFETAKAALEKQGIKVADEPIEKTPDEDDKDKFKAGEVMGTDPVADTLVEKVVTSEDIDDVSSEEESSEDTSSSEDKDNKNNAAAMLAQVSLKTTQEGEEVAIVICTVDFPDLIGLSEDEAVKQIETVGLKAKVTKMYHDASKADEGEVFEQSIEKGTSTADIKDDTCEIFVSVGELVITVAAPSEYDEDSYTVEVTCGSKTVTQEYSSSTKNKDFKLVPSESEGKAYVYIDGSRYQEWYYEAGKDPYIVNDYSENFVTVSEEPSSEEPSSVTEVSIPSEITSSAVPSTPSEDSSEDTSSEDFNNPSEITSSELILG